MAQDTLAIWATCRNCGDLLEAISNAEMSAEAQLQEMQDNCEAFALHVESLE